MIPGRNKGVRNYKPAAPSVDERSAFKQNSRVQAPAFLLPATNARLRRTAKPLMGGNRSREPLASGF